MNLAEFIVAAHIKFASKQFNFFERAFSFIFPPRGLARVFLGLFSHYRAKEARKETRLKFSAGLKPVDDRNVKKKKRTESQAKSLTTVYSTLCACNPIFDTISRH